MNSIRWTYRAVVTRATSICLLAAAPVWGAEPPAMSRDSVHTTPAAMADDLFIYRGQLAYRDEPLNGVVNLEFQLYAGESDTYPIGPSVFADEWPVIEGRVWVGLDFGDDVNLADGAWLELTIDGTVLSPRQYIAPRGWSVNGAVTRDRRRQAHVVDLDRIQEKESGESSDSIANEAQHAERNTGDRTGANVNRARSLGGMAHSAAAMNDGANEEREWGRQGINQGNGGSDGESLAGGDGTGLLFNSGNRFLNATDSVYINIDADDNDPDSRLFEIGKNRWGDVGGISLFRVNESGNIGIGTINPVNPLHVTHFQTQSPVIFGHAARVSGSSAAGVTGQSEGVAGTGVYGYAASPNGLTYGVRGYAYSTNGIGVYGSAQRETGVSYGVSGLATSQQGTGVWGYASNSSGVTYGIKGTSASPTGYAGYFQGRGYFSGDVGIGITNPGAKLDVLGDSRFRNRLRLGSAAGTAGQLTIADSNDGSIHAIDAESDTTVFPTIYARNTAANGSVLWAEGNSDAGAAGGGIIVAGDQGGENIAIDANEIMARDAGQPSTLHLNAEGGQIKMGQYDIHPAFAYGKVYTDGTLISGSSNITSTTRVEEGKYRITIEGGFHGNDIALVSNAGYNVDHISMFGDVSQGNLDVWAHFRGDLRDNVFTFVVFRP